MTLVVQEQQFGLNPGQSAYYAWIIIEGKKYRSRGRSKADAINQLMAMIPNGTKIESSCVSSR